MSCTKVLEVKVGTQDTAIQECKHKILFLQTQSAHTDIALRDINNRIGDITSPHPRNKVSPLSEVALTSHSVSHCLPVGLLRDTWTWRDIFTGTQLLVPLES